MMAFPIFARKPEWRSPGRRAHPYSAACPMPVCATSSTGSKRAGRLVRVAAPVSPYLEMTEIQTRLLAEGGPAALFENVVRTGGGSYAMPVLVNLFGTVERVAWGMDREPQRPARDRRDARLPEAAGAARRLARGARHAAAAADGDGDAAAHRRRRRRARRSCCAAARSTLARCRSRPAGRASRRR